MENISFDDLGLLLGVIGIRMVLHILFHGHQFPVVYCDIFTYSMSFLIHSILRLLVVWNLFMCSLDHHSIFYNRFILHFTWLYLSW
jgi:hypothetical protein